jgi:hypothetical protein
MSDTSITPGQIPLPAESYATPDGLTITGAGVAENPLTTDGGADTMGNLEDIFTTSTFLPGTPVYPLLYNSGTGLTELAQAVASTVATAGVIGLAVPGFHTGRTAVVSGGLLTLTTAEWDAVVQGESGGLVVGQSYYLNANGAQKPITTAAPSGSNNAYVGIGTAISPTTMAIKINAPLNVTTP